MATINVNVGVANSYIVLYNITNNTSTQVLTNSSGSYSFTGLAVGSYSVYNTAIDTTGQNPPTKCGFPSGYTGTTHPRRQDVTLPLSTSTSTLTFDFDKPVPWSSLYGGNPPPYGLTTLGGVNLATGAVFSIPTISNNGFGYSIKDNMIYGQGAQSRTDATGTTVTLNPVVDLTNGTNINVADCNFEGLLILPAMLGTCTRMCAMCIDPLNLLYLRPVNIFDPTVELTAAPYGTNFSPGLTTAADQAFVPGINSIVWIANGVVQRFSLDTISATTIPITGIARSSSGAICFADMKNFYCPTGSKIYRLTLTDTIAVGSNLSDSPLSGASGDGARAANMPIYYSQPFITKRVNKAFASPGDTLIYTTTIINIGIADGITDTFIDTIPSGTSFISGTVVVDGVSNATANPNNIDLGSLIIGQIRTVTFNVVVTSTITNTALNNIGTVSTVSYDSITNLNYTFNYQSNIVTTTVIAPYIDIKKGVDRDYGGISDVIKYTITITNTATIVGTKAFLVDTVPIGSTFINNSLNVDGVTIIGGNLNPPTGYSLGTISAGQIITVTFSVNVVSIPSNNKIDNIAKLSYITNATPTVTMPLLSYSNIVTTTLIQADFTNTKKYVDLAYGTSGSIITYTIGIPNTGNTDGFNVFFIDTIPNDTTYVNNSLTINDVPVINTFPTIVIGTIPASTTTTIVYKVRVN